MEPTEPVLDINLVGFVIGIFGTSLAVFMLIIDWTRIKNTIKSWSYKYQLFLFGPSGGGKSTLIHYLDTGVFASAPPKTTILTTKNVAFDLSGKDFYKFTIRRSIEVGGEFGVHVERELLDLDPHAILFVFQWDQPIRAQEQCKELTDALKKISARHSYKNRRLSAILFFMNKIDTFEKTRTHVAALLQQFQVEYLASYLSELRKICPGVELIFEGISIKDPQLRFRLDDAFRRLAYLLTANP